MTNKKLRAAFNAMLTDTVIPTLTPMVNAMDTLRDLHSDILSALTDVFTRLQRLEAAVLPAPRGGASGETQVFHGTAVCPLCDRGKE